MIYEAPKFADALVAATLVTATFTVLTAIWQPQVDSALATERDDDSGRRGASARRVAYVFAFRSLPLAAAAVATVVILSFRAIPIAKTVGCGLRCPLDDVEALYVVNAALLACLALGSLLTVTRLALLWLSLVRAD